MGQGGFGAVLEALRHSSVKIRNAVGGGCKALSSRIKLREACYLLTAQFLRSGFPPKVLLRYLISRPTSRYSHS